MATAAQEVRGAAAPDSAAAIAERVRASGTSFYWAMRLLPLPRREAMYAIYAFCREVDDIADSDDPAASKLEQLDAWRARIEALYKDRTGTALLDALRIAVDAYALRREDFLAIIDGMEMDARSDIRAPSLAVLDLYCARVASAVGHLSVHAFGDPSAAAHQVADSLGRALQLTNILRDLAEDAARGRLYLPQELLAARGIADTEPALVLGHADLHLVCRDLASRARQHYADANAAMGRCSRRAMRPAAVMSAVYRATLDRLAAADWRDLAAPARIPKPVKLWLVLRHGLV